jgi:hypothetical protein
LKSTIAAARLNLPAGAAGNLSSIAEGNVTVWGLKKSSGY